MWASPRKPTCLIFVPLATQPWDAGQWAGAHPLGPVRPPRLLAQGLSCWVLSASSQIPASS